MPGKNNKESHTRGGVTHTRLRVRIDGMPPVSFDTDGFRWHVKVLNPFFIACHEQSCSLGDIPLSSLALGFQMQFGRKQGVSQA